LSDFTRSLFHSSNGSTPPLKELSIKYNVTPSLVARNWLIQYNEETVVAIPGATKEIHVKEKCGAMSFSLSDEDVARLD